MFIKIRRHNFMDYSLPEKKIDVRKFINMIIITMLKLLSDVHLTFVFGY